MPPQPTAHALEGGCNRLVRRCLRDPAAVTGRRADASRSQRDRPSTTRVIRLVAIPIAPRISPERQNLSAGFHAAAILAMTRWITAPVTALDDAGRLPHICYSPRAAPGPRRSNARSQSRAFTATPPLVLLRRAGTWSREVWMPRLHDRQRKGATTDVVAMRRDRQARAVCRVYGLPAAEVADLRSAYESGDHRF
jgi:hypothetical protein